MRFEGEVAVVTGAASGIGRATADLFAEHGAPVYAIGVAAREPAERLIPVRHDAGVERDWRVLVARIADEAGRLDILVDNAGIVGTYDTITEIAMDAYRQVITVNRTGAFLGTRHAIPLMLRGGSGAIVDISSIRSLIGATGVAPYQASKGALTTLTRNAAPSYAPLIRAASIHPDAIRTRIIAEQDEAMNRQLIDDTPPRRMAEPREVALAALYLASGEAGFVTGAELVIDGGYTIRQEDRLRKVTIADAPALPRNHPDLSGASVRELVSRRTTGSGRGSLFITTFEPGGTHVLHRHTTSGQLSYLLGGIGEHLTENGGIPLQAGDVTFARPGEWHGFRNTGNEPAVLVSLYSPAGDLSDTGYETHPGEVRGSATPEVARISLSAPQGDAVPSGDEHDLGSGVFWFATRDTLGTDGVLLGSGTFEPGKVQELHRHPNGDEILLVLEGGGEHLTLDGTIPLSAGQIAYAPAGEYHGFRNHPGISTGVLLGYFGAATLEEAGNEKRSLSGP